MINFLKLSLLGCIEVEHNASCPLSPRWNFVFPVSSVHSSERLEKENEELRVALEDALHTLQGKHRNDLAELEQRLQAFYQAERDKVHLSYQEEADKCRSLMQQQVGLCSTFRFVFWEFLGRFPVYIIELSLFNPVENESCVLVLKIEELKANHEAMKLELEKSHEEQLQCVKQQYDTSLEGEWTIQTHSISCIMHAWNIGTLVFRFTYFDYMIVW